MKKSLIFLTILSLSVWAGLPPTTSKVIGDAANKTTFNFQFPNFTGTHTGTTIALGVNNIAGGGTNSSAALTNNKAMQSVGGAIVESTVTSTELGYLSGVTSAIQTQLNNKITGPASATDNAIARFDLTTGKLAKNSGVLIDNSNNITGIVNETVSGDITLSGAQFNSIKIGQELALLTTTGVTDGALLSINASPALWNITQQSLSFSDQTVLAAPVIRRVTCPALTNQTVTNIATQDSTYLLIDSACVITQQSTFPTQAQRRSKAFLGRLSHSNHTTLSAAVSLPDLAVDSNSQLYDLFDAMGAFNVTGNIISPNGANLSFNKSVGAVFRRSANYASSNQNPHVPTTAATVAGAFFKATQTTVNPVTTTVLDVANFDVAGTVTPMSSAPAPTGVSTSANHRVYLFSNGTLAVQYGQVKYNNLANAIAGISTESFNINPQAADGGILLAIISCRRDATDLSNSAQCQISRVGRFDQSGVSIGSLATTTLQQAYDNSTTPQITTSTTGGSVDIRRGSAADTDNVIRIQNGAGTATASITGNGDASAASMVYGGTKAASAIVDMQSTTRGMLIPRMTTTQMNAIASPATGLKIYNTDFLAEATFNGTTWQYGFGNILGDVTYSAKVSSAAVVTDENKEFITGNCVISGTSVYTCAITGFTVAPNCQVTSTAGNAAPESPINATVTATSVAWETRVSNGAQAVGSTVISCEKTGADYLAASTSVFATTNANHSRRAYTPTFTGFGTVSNIECYESRNGEFNDIDCKFTAAVPAASEARVSLPGINVSSSLLTLRNYGSWGRVTSSANHGGLTLIEPSVGYVTFSAATTFSNTGSATIAKANGNDMIGNGETLSFTARIPIQGWVNSNIMVGSFGGYGKTPGVDVSSTPNLDIFKVNYGATATTNCTTGTCAYLDQQGTAVTSVSVSGTTYTLTTARTYSKLKCSINAVQAGTATAQGLINAINNNTFTFTTITSSATAVNSYGLIDCTGTY